MRHLIVLAVATALPASVFAQTPRQPEVSRTRPPEPTGAEISVRDAMTRTYIIADDSMEGRDTGRRGGVRSANYIANELKRLGIEPAGDNGTYFQAIPWLFRKPDTTSSLEVAGTTLRPGTDFFLLPKLGPALALGGQPFGGGFQGTGVPTIYGGRIGDSTIAPDQVRGKVVIFAPPSTDAGFAFWQRDNMRRYAGAKAIVIATLELGVPQQFRVGRETYWDANAPLAARPMTVILVTTAVAARILGRPLTAVAVGAAGSPISGHAAFIDSPAEAPSYNVVGILRGSDAKLRNSYVAVGAHHDHIGIGRGVDHDSIRAFNAIVRERGADDPPPRQVTEAQWSQIRIILDSLRAAHAARVDSINNGADDDASGSVLELEIAEAFAMAPRKPKRSLLFVWHTAEEKGLFGAQYYSDHPTVPRDSIVAQINMDQMGRGEPVDKPTGGPNSLVVIGSRRLSTELGDLAERVNAKSQHAFRFDYSFDKDGDPTNAYCRSDHYMYARYGIPVVFFSAAAWHVDYHMVSDEPQYIAYDRMTRIGRYIRDVVGEVADLDRRPTVDKAKPDPDGLCKQ